jgi:cytochrome c2
MSVLRRYLASMAIAASLVTAFAMPVRADDAPGEGGDAAHGKVVFNQCLVCHVIVPGGKKIGPSLWGVIGRHSATLPGFEYSKAMQAYDKVWGPATLDVYLTAPMKQVPGTKMAFAGLAKEQDRKDVIAYLETLK